MPTHLQAVLVAIYCDGLNERQAARLLGTSATESAPTTRKHSQSAKSEQLAIRLNPPDSGNPNRGGTVVAM